MPEMLPDVSVVMPFRDAADTLGEAIDSVLAQRGPRYEVIAVDDGSTDGSADRLPRDPRIVPVATGGVGLAAALERGRAAARAPWLARMDADDVALPDRFARQLELAQSDDRLGLVAARVEAFPAAAVGRGLARYVAWQNGLVSPEDHARELFIEAPVCHPSVLLRATAVDQVGGWRAFDGPEDYDLWLRLDSAGWRMAKVPAVLLRWRHQEGRATFADPRYARERFTETKAPHLAARVRSLGRPVAMWGAGRSGKRMARALEPFGIRPDVFVDIDRAKIGNVARGVPIAAPASLRRGAHTVIVAVGAIGARDEIREHLARMEFVEGCDYLCAR